MTLLGFVLAAAAAVIFVGGTLLGLLSADDGDGPTSVDPRPDLTELVATSELIVEGTAARTERVGDPSDAGALATIEVDKVIASPAGAPDEVLVYDQGFRETWSEGQRMLLFLGVEGSLPGDAEFRVRDRCVLEEGALPCPYEVDDIRRALED